MPQDSRRSIGYRSFVTCDDPKGVVECGTIRRSKTSSHKMEQSIERRSIVKHSNKSSALETEREETVTRQTAAEFGGRTSFQLLEVSMGAQKLNKMIETWSKGLNFDGQYKDNIAKDLLKGALDLQESLVMLGKLQAATKYVTRLKQKQEKSEAIQGDEVGFGKTKSDLSEDRNRFTELQKPHLLDDRTSKRDIEELRKAIRESFARQNLLPSPVYRGKDYFHRQNTDSVSSMPSTSSSHSSTVNNDNLDFANSSFPSAMSREKAKSPSVIAKLMGLEEFPSKLAQSPPRKRFEPQRYSLQERPAFDVVIPKMKKPENKAQNVDMAQRTLREIVDTVQLKELLRSNSSRKTKPLSQLFDECDSEEERPVIDVPPIVLIKPISLPYSEAEEHFSWRDGVLNPQLILKTRKLKEEYAPKPMDPKGAARICEKMNTVKEEEDSPTQQGGEKKFNEDDRKSTKEKKSGKSLKKMKLPVQASRQPLKKEATGRRSNDHEKAMKEVSKSRSNPQFQDPNKVTSAKLVNPVTEVNRKNKSTQHGANLKTKSKTVTSVLPCNQDDLKKVQTRRMKEKPAMEKKEARPPKMNDRECKELGGKTDFSTETHSVQVEATSTHVDQQTMLEKENASDFETGEEFSNGQNIGTIPTLRYEGDNNSAAKAGDHIPQREHEESYKRRCHAKIILLTDPSFLAHAQELFEFTQCPTVLEGLEKFQSGLANERLYLDFAKELIDRKSLRACQKSYFLLTTLQGASRICISMDKLLEEICDGIDNLNDCCEFASAKLSVDGLYAVLERDIWSKGMANGTWESGWTNGYSLDDAEQVVNDITMVLFSRLIEEAVAELSNFHCE